MTRDELLAELAELAGPVAKMGKADGSGTGRYSATAHWTEYGDGRDYPADPPEAALKVSSGRNDQRPKISGSVFNGPKFHTLLDDYWSGNLSLPQAQQALWDAVQELWESQKGLLKAFGNSKLDIPWGGINSGMVTVFEIALAHKNGKWPGITLPFLHALINRLEAESNAIESAARPGGEAYSLRVQILPYPHLPYPTDEQKEDFFRGFRKPN